MNIQLNGDARSIKAATLEELLIEAGFADAMVATAVNGAFVPAPNRIDLTLKDGDSIEVLAPMQGG
jgi:sulfur carrier protein